MTQNLPNVRNEIKENVHPYIQLWWNVVKKKKFVCLCKQNVVDKVHFFLCLLSSNSLNEFTETQNTKREIFLFFVVFNNICLLLRFFQTCWMMTLLETTEKADLWKNVCLNFVKKIAMHHYWQQHNNNTICNNCTSSLVRCCCCCCCCSCCCALNSKDKASNELPARKTRFFFFWVSSFMFEKSNL